MPSGGLKHFQKVSWQTAVLEIGKLPENFICLVLAGALRLKNGPVGTYTLWNEFDINSFVK